MMRNRIGGLVVAAAAVVILVGLIFGGTSSGGLKEIHDAGRRAIPMYERNCPHPSPGQWCPWVDDGEVQPQPVWP